MYYNYFKALHLIFVITWFAGLFYSPRLFIYHIEALKKEKIERNILIKQYQLMAKRLWYIITWPSAILAIFFASLLIIINPFILYQSWMIHKLGFVFLLILYHLKTHMIFIDLQKNKVIYTSMFMRLWNEGATLLLFAIIFLIILRDSLQTVFFILGFLLLALILFFSIKLYKKYLKSNE